MTGCGGQFMNNKKKTGRGGDGRGVPHPRPIAIHNNNDDP